jgi:hypothetical protein
MVKLNLPGYQFRIQNSEKGTRIFDPIRKKFIALTPEEWVRQNFLQYIIEEKKYPAALIAVETGLLYNRLKKRSDITVYDKKGKVWMIIECKAPEVKISQDTFDQVATYNMSQKKNAGAKHQDRSVLTKTKFLAVTNGLKHYCCEMNYEQDKYDFLKDFPEFI